MRIQGHPAAEEVTFYRFEGDSRERTDLGTARVLINFRPERGRRGERSTFSAFEDRYPATAKMDKDRNPGLLTHDYMERGEGLSPRVFLITRVIVYATPMHRYVDLELQEVNRPAQA